MDYKALSKSELEELLKQETKKPTKNSKKQTDTSI